jgi:hypothetical protein
MEVLKTYIVYEHNEWQVMFYCGEGNYYISSAGAFGQRDLKLEIIAPSRAEQLLDDHRGN